MVLVFANMMLHLLYAIQVMYRMLMEKIFVTTRTPCQTVPQPYIYVTCYGFICDLCTRQRQIRLFRSDQNELFIHKQDKALESYTPYFGW